MQHLQDAVSMFIVLVLPCPVGQSHFKEATHILHVLDHSQLQA